MMPKKGFTMIELLLVLALIASMAGFIFIRLTGAQSGARDAQRKSDIRQYQNAIEIWSNRNGGQYPNGNPTISAVSLCSSGGALSGVRCSDDPRASQGGTSYRYNTDASRSRYVLWSILEKNNELYYVCSSGVAQTRTRVGWVDPTDGSCP